MAQGAFELDKPSERQTTRELSLSRIGRAWASQPRGPRFTRALVDFLRSLNAADTMRSYALAIVELFEWFDEKRRTIPTPDEVTRADAQEFAKWLERREHGLNGYRLANDPNSRLDDVIHRIVSRHPGIRYGQLLPLLLDVAELTELDRDAQGRIVRVLRRSDCPSGLDRRLSELVIKRILRRSPTLSQLRRGDVTIEGFTGDPSQLGITIPISPDVFRYSIVEASSPTGVERSGTIVARVTPLSSFWSYLMASGENRAEEQALLRVNIWLDVLGRSREQAATQQVATRAAKTPDVDLFVRLLATTYEHRLGKEQSILSARQTLFGTPPDTGPRTRYSDLRDRALLVLMAQVGPRAAEVTRLQRQDVASGEPPILTIRGKRGRKRQVAVPAGSLVALQHLTTKLKLMAAHQNRYGGSGRANDLLEPSAPLFPAIRLWGKNADVPDAKTLTRPALAMMLRRRAIEAGIAPESAEFARCHPHGIRHLFAQVARDSGTPLPTIQAAMGHASLATTGRYVEERRPEAIIAEAFRPSAQERHVTGVSEAPKPAVPGPPPRVVRVVPEVTVEAPALPQKRPQEALEVQRPQRQGRPQKRPLAEPAPEQWAAFEACAAGLVGTARVLCEIYMLDWGERGNRQRFAGRAELAKLEGAVEKLRAAGESDGSEEALIPEDVNRLVHSYVGKESGLVWWDGVNGDLDLSMPVMSAWQVGSCSETQADAVCEGLAALWTEWMEGKTHGQTAARALVSWIGEALEEAAEVDLAMRARDADWVPTEADWDATAIGPKDERLVFREHDSKRVVEWFRKVAWQYRTSRGRTETEDVKSRRAAKVLGTLHVPEWYGDADPIGTLAPEERAELIDVINVLVGDLRLQDRTPRYGSTSRSDAAELVVAMVDYDKAKDNEGELRKEMKAAGGGASYEIDLARLRDVSRAAAGRANLIAERLSGKSFDLVEFAKARAKRQRAGATRENRSDFYMRVLGELLGPVAACDPLLRLISAGGEGTLSAYRDLLHADPLRQTIVHPEAFKREFAEATGAHSECVARRIARHLYDLWRARAQARICTVLAEQAQVSPELATKYLTGQLTAARVARRPDAAEVRDGMERMRKAERELGLRHSLPSDAKAFDRPQDLRDLVASMQAFKVPCPSVQEMELRRLLGAPSRALPIFESWREARERGRDIVRVPPPRPIVEAVERMPAAVPVLTSEAARYEKELPAEYRRTFREAYELARERQYSEREAFDLAKRYVREMEISGEFSGIEEEYEPGERAGEIMTEYERNPRAQRLRFTRRAARMLPNPIRLIIATAL